MEVKPCPICEGEMRLENKTPRDKMWGPSFYCSNEECGHREWEGGPGPTSVDVHQTLDWKTREYQARKDLQAVEISDNLWLGDLIDAWKLRDQGTGQPFDAILNVSNNTYTPPPDVEFAHFPLTEYGSKPAKRQKRAEALRAAIGQLKSWLGDGKKVFVHCTAGFNRSVAVVMAILMEQGLTYREALETVRSKRPNAWPHGEISFALRDLMSEEKESSAMGTGDFLPLQPTGQKVFVETLLDPPDPGERLKQAARKYAVDEAADFVAQTDWNKPFDENYYKIRESNAPIEEQDIGIEFFQPPNEDSERFVQADILIDQTMGSDRVAKTAAIRDVPPAIFRVWSKAHDLYEEFYRNPTIELLDALIKSLQVFLAQSEPHLPPTVTADAQNHISKLEKAMMSIPPGGSPEAESLSNIVDYIISIIHQDLVKKFETSHHEWYENYYAPNTRPRTYAAKKPPKKQLRLFEKGEEEEELKEPRLSIKPPMEVHYELLSKRGLKLPAPEVFNNEIYQAIYERAPLIPLDPKDPASIDRSIEFLKTTKGISAGKAQEYFRIPTVFGSKRVDHIMYASWFAMFSPNMAVEAEETMFVLWQAGKSGADPGRSGIMANKTRIIDWLNFLKWAGFPRFRNLYKVLEGFDTSDESYQRRMTALSRNHGWQLKVSSFFLALMGDTRSPTLDMHALGYLIESGKLELSEDREWTPLSELAEMSNQLRKLSRGGTRSDYDPTFWTQGRDTPVYRDLKIKYDEKVAINKKTLSAITASVRVGAEPPKTEAGRKAEEERVKEYMRRQMEGWDGNTDNFWSWYSSNPFFKTHEPMKDAIHTVFFQSLFPELFTPEQLFSRDELFKQWSDPEKVDEREMRMRYRNYLENLQKMREIQPRKEPLVTQETPGAQFDWSTGKWKVKRPRKKVEPEEEGQEMAAVVKVRERLLARKQRMQT